ncbi:ectoine/hydroxyectoine ABC transporter permease subunit EhuD [Paenibacillus sp. J2TS4]|uniref:ectoine/hydroxyectoine ABC transporter permease subunit EhuD n=1 Tax=Paenibacillus sp. J2TS4 TaxID=2807194 RepID=UPI001B16371C|nr:ectoine/hydroxyectoine ABC transporter permease subunit EhuD [Paenibacillus sp. J2TS4]GIP33168.1 ectoine/hydroxyectoine ABC transporter permease subunit EhuD [Paenibacillus sp. J2TS4]
MWNWDYAFDILPKMLRALPITIAATLVGFIIASLFGLLLAVMRRSRHKIISYPVIGFVEFVRNTPLLVQLFFLFYALPLYGIALSPFLCGVIGLGLHYSTYLSEVYRSGIDAVERGQWEASTALNFSKGQTWLRVILPQAIPPIIPVMGNYLIVMFKETPLLSAITVVELMTTAKSIGSQSFRYVEVFTMVGVLFFILSYASSLIVRSLENRLTRR